MVILHIEDGGEVPQRYRLEPGTYLLGRAPESSIVLDRPGVEERHCELTVYETGDCVVRDAGSASGVYVDGSRVQVGAAIPGQWLSLGSVRMTLETEGIAEAAGPGPELELESREASTASRSLWASIPDALAWPIRVDAWIPIVFLALLAEVPALFPGAFQSIGIVGSALVGVYVLQWAREIILAAANGEDGPHSTPDFVSGMSEIRERIFQFVALGLIAFGPGYAASLLPGASVWMVPICGLSGGVYFPMGLLCLVLLDVPGALSPDLVVRSIVRVWGDYVPVLLVFGVTFGLDFAVGWVGQRFMGSVGLRVGLGLAGGVVALYLQLVCLRLIGLLYWNNRDRLAWSF